jgi:hypothetical protein
MFYAVLNCKRTQFSESAGFVWIWKKKSMAEAIPCRGSLLCYIKSYKWMGVFQIATKPTRIDFIWTRKWLLLRNLQYMYKKDSHLALERSVEFSGIISIRIYHLQQKSFKYTNDRCSNIHSRTLNLLKVRGEFFYMKDTSTKFRFLAQKGSILTSMLVLYRSETCYFPLTPLSIINKGPRSFAK